MSRFKVRLALCFLLICSAASLMAQQAASADSIVPSLAKFTGTLAAVDGKPLTGTVGVTFSLYKEQTGGAPLWMETQNVQADKNGHYSAMLGAASAHGMPPEVFVAGEARWLGVQPSGQAEQPRTLLFSVPYALKALDAETLGGKPASAFMAASGLGAGATAKGGPGQDGPQVEQKNEIVCSSSTNCKTGFVPLFSTSGGSAQVSDSIINQSSGGISIAGTESVTSSGSTPAILGTSTGSSGTSNGVQGVTSSGTGAGVVGINNSTDSNATGIYGYSNSYGIIASSPGVGIRAYSSGTGGGAIAVQGITFGNATGFYTDSNVQQARTAGGWVKAMVYYSGMNSGSVVSCFNSTLAAAAATTPPCGFSATKNGTGDYTLDFGFEVDDRFFSVSNTNWFATTGLCTDWNGACSSGSWTPSQVEVFTFLPPYNSYSDTKFYLIVY